MVSFIQEEKKSKIKKYFLLGISAAAIAGATYQYNINNDFWKPRVHTILSINSPESLEYRLENIREDLKEYPQYTDKLVRAGIKAIVEEEKLCFSPETYLEMFNVMKIKFEEKPELLNHLGTKALEYQDSRKERRYKQSIKDAYNSIKEKAKEAIK